MRMQAAIDRVLIFGDQYCSGLSYRLPQLQQSCQALPIPIIVASTNSCTICHCYQEAVIKQWYMLFILTLHCWFLTDTNLSILLHLLYKLSPLPETSLVTLISMHKHSNKIHKWIYKHREPPVFLSASTQQFSSWGRQLTVLTLKWAFVLYWCAVTLNF